MSDPRNVAHDKKVKQEKHHETSPGVAANPKKRRSKVADQKEDPTNTAGAAEVTKVEQVPGDFEKSQAVLSKLKEIEFHSRANIETLAELTLTVDELKQKEFSGPIGDVYGAQDGFQTKIAALIESYEAKCETLKPSS